MTQQNGHVPTPEQQQLIDECLKSSTAQPLIQSSIKLEVGITPDEKVLLNFGPTPVCWLSFSVEQAENIIKGLQGCIDEIKAKGR